MKITKQNIEESKKEFDEDIKVDAINEEDLVNILQKMITMEFAKEEDMINFFDEQYKRVISSMKYQWYKKKNMKPNIWDPKHEDKGEDYLKDRDFERGGKTMALDEWAFDKQNIIRQWERQQENTGKYPEGFRHYENYVNYRQVFQDATVEQYMRDMNREVTFIEMMNIMKSAIT